MIAYPDVRENSSMYTDLAHEFSINGHEIYVAVANGPKSGTLRIEGGVNVLRVKTMELFDTHFILKGIANLLLPYQVLRAISSNHWNLFFDAVIIATPPITYLRIAKKLKKKGSKVYLILRDIFPQNAKDLGLIQNKYLFSYFRKKEKKLYAISDYIGCMSDGNIRYVIKNNPEVQKEKLHILSNWKAVAKFSNPSLDLKNSIGLEGKFIIVYGGNLGKPQDVESIIEYADHISYLQDVVFLLIGNGTEKKRLIQLCRQRNLENILFKDSLPRKKYEDLVKVCDVGLVINNRLFTIPNIPSRTLSYWEAKIPVLATLDPYTDFGKIIHDSASGLWSLTGDKEAFKENFLKLYSNKSLRLSMGENGYAYLQKNCSVENAYNIISEKIIS
jgi:glycosyltransferase involved in cell wall biosynthesis